MAGEAGSVALWDTVFPEVCLFFTAHFGKNSRFSGYFMHAENLHTLCTYSIVCMLQFC